MLKKVIMKKRVNLILAMLSTLALTMPVFAHMDHHSQATVSKVGKPANPSKAKRVIEVTTSDDMRFKFDKNLDINNGEIITFKVTNVGNVNHEFSIGDEKEQQAHRKMMQKMPNMVHEDDNTVTVKPGETKLITWQFKSGEEVVISCNIPGHYEAGMVKRVNVKPN